jgi:precorrin-6A/cobalt-precorrin-6A reductase
VLGGTSEARELGELMAGDSRFSVQTSLAGRTSSAAPSDQVRIGGFGGAVALAAYLGAGRFGAVVDATHPFAATITSHAVAAARQVDVPLLVLRRPGWSAASGDDWRRVPDVESAAAALRALPAQTVFLAIGRAGLACFADVEQHRYLLRMIEAPEPGGPLPALRTVLFERGPFTVDGERALLRARHVDLLVTKDSGGAATRAKLVAARELRLPALVIDRPPLPAGVTVLDSASAALGWLESISPSR